MIVNFKNVDGFYLETPFYGKERIYLSYDSGKKIKISRKQFNILIQKRKQYYENKQQTIN